MTRILLVSGGGAYSDPWHPFAETSACLRSILEDESEAEITVSADVVGALSSLQADQWDLVVVNIGAGGDSPGVAADGDDASVDGVMRHVDAGGPLLVCHVSATAFPEDPRWESVLGGRWVRGISMHPDLDDAHIRIAAPEHPVTAGLDDFTLTDERYSYLRVSDDVDVLATHRHDDLTHPLAWAHTYAGERGRARFVYDGLGHDARSFTSPQHRTLVRNARAWLLPPTARG